jgi:hypothetical protein
VKQCWSTGDVKIIETEELVKKDRSEHTNKEMKPKQIKEEQEIS